MRVRAASCTWAECPPHRAPVEPLGVGIERLLSQPEPWRERHDHRPHPQRSPSRSRLQRALCALNTVGGALSAVVGCGGARRVRVEESHSGGVQVWTLDMIDRPERHADQSAFAVAYGLNTGA